jgi:hypothetical protein
MTVRCLRTFWHVCQASCVLLGLQHPKSTGQCNWTTRMCMCPHRHECRRTARHVVPNTVTATGKQLVGCGDKLPRLILRYFQHLLWGTQWIKPVQGSIFEDSTAEYKAGMLTTRPQCWSTAVIIIVSRSKFITFPGGKARPGRDADHSPLSSVEVVN